MAPKNPASVYSFFKVKKRYAPLTRTSKITLSITELNNLTGFRSEVLWIARSLSKQQRDLEVLKSQAYWAHKELEKIRATVDAIAEKRVDQCHLPEPPVLTRCPNP